MATKRARKTAKKTAKPKPRKIRQPKGKGALYAGGVPGNKGGGRPLDAFKAMCQRLASREETERAVDRILRNQNHPAFMGALKWATEHGYGQPRAAIELTGKNGGPIEVDTESARLRILARLARLEPAKSP